MEHYAGRIFCCRCLRRRRTAGPDEQSGSAPIPRTAARSKRPRQWRTTPPQGRRSSTIAVATRSSGSSFDKCRTIAVGLARLATMGSTPNRRCSTHREQGAPHVHWEFNLSKEKHLTRIFALRPTVGGRNQQADSRICASSTTPAAARRLESPCGRRHDSSRAPAARIYAPHGARAAAALPEMRRKKQSLARRRISAARLKFRKSGNMVGGFPVFIQRSP